MNNLKDCTQGNGTKIISRTAKEQIVCPVCKKVVHECDLPDRDSVITDNVYFGSGILIVDSDVTIHCEFEHSHDEQKNVLDEYHGLIAVIRAQFNVTGECILFEIVEILNQDTGGD
jgi:hypothetical protein